MPSSALQCGKAGAESTCSILTAADTGSRASFGRTGHGEVTLHADGYSRSVTLPCCVNISCQRSNRSGSHAP